MAADATTASVGGLEEIVVTAQRRSENIQNVPITIQALTGDALSKLNVVSLDDFVKYLPNVATATNGPGAGSIYMRGLAVGNTGTESSGTIGGFPNVAVYLDEQSGQLPNRNLDVYAVDLERIEVLEGPQGTLFGGGAQAGVVRYITNKPKLDKTEASFDAGYSTTAHGDPNSAMSAVFNLPVIADKLAVRAVIYNENRGGYIDNVPSTFTRRDSDLAIKYAGFAKTCADAITFNPAAPPVQGVCGTGAVAATYGVPPGSEVTNNYQMAHNDINTVTYKGLRAQALFKINEDWDVLFSQAFQNMDTDGVFYQLPKSSEGVTLAPLQVTSFSPSWNKDKFTNTALTVNGKIGDLKLLYSGGYLDRNIDQVNDYSDYARGAYGGYYQCLHSPGAGKQHCFGSAMSWRELERNTHLSHELRLSSPDDWRLRGIAGAYWENLQIQDRTEWSYKTVPSCSAAAPTNCFADTGPVPGAYVIDPTPREGSVGFWEDVHRGYKQTAFFASLDFDLIPKVLTLTAGTRHYKYTTGIKGAVTDSFGCYHDATHPAGPGPCTGDSVDIGAVHPDEASYSGYKSKGTITWHVTPDVMLYATWSQGYRPGNFNRKGGLILKGADVYTAANAPTPAKIGTNIPQYEKPVAFAPDELTNKEFGWKTQFLNNRLQINGSVYEEQWKNVQTALYNPLYFGNLTFGTNGPDFRVRGLELQFVGRVMDGLTVQASGSWNQSEQLNSPNLVGNVPASASFGKPITSYFTGITPLNQSGITQLANPFGNPGGPTAYSPPLKYTLGGRYDWTVNGFGAFVQASGSFVGHSYSETNNYPNGDELSYVSTTALRYEMKSYTTYDLSFGISKDNWTLSFVGQNMGDSNASQFTSSGQFIKAEVPVRPRVMGIRYGMKF
jgi:outer membrane receptor protein involved in Fe transport